MTARDRELIDWLSWVRLADTSSVRTMLGALGGAPVSKHVAVRRIAKLRDVGLVDTGRVHHRSSQVVWPTKEATGRVPQSPYTATSVHALTTAAATAQLRAAGVLSVEDLAEHKMRHRVSDAVLTWPDGQREFLEVELTVKQPERLRTKLRHMRERWAEQSASGTLYAATPAAARAVARMVELTLPLDQRHRVRLVDRDDLVAGRWVAHSPTSAPLPAAPLEEAPAAEEWRFDE